MLWPSRGVAAAAAVFVYAYLLFVAAIFAWINFMPDLLFPQ